MVGQAGAAHGPRADAVEEDPLRGGVDRSAVRVIRSLAAEASHQSHGRVAPEQSSAGAAGGMVGAGSLEEPGRPSAIVVGFSSPSCVSANRLARHLRFWLRDIMPQAVELMSDGREVVRPSLYWNVREPVASTGYR